MTLGPSLRFILVLALATGCMRETPQTTLEPPDVAAPAPAPPELSRFSVPLEYDFTAVLRLVEQIVPAEFGSMDSVKTVGGDSRNLRLSQPRVGAFVVVCHERSLADGLARRDRYHGAIQRLEHVCSNRLCHPFRYEEPSCTPR